MHTEFNFIKYNSLFLTNAIIFYYYLKYHHKEQKSFLFLFSLLIFFTTTQLDHLYILKENLYFFLVIFILYQSRIAFLISLFFGTFLDICLFCII